MTHFEPFSQIYEPDPPERSSTKMPWTVAGMSLVGWGLSFGTLILLGLTVHPLVTWLKQSFFQVRWDAPFDSWSIHSLEDPLSSSSSLLADLPYSSDKTRIYVLPEQDILKLFQRLTRSTPLTSQGGVGADELLLELWNEATTFDLDELDEDQSLGDLLAGLPDIPSDALHAIVFTFTEED